MWLRKVVIKNFRAIEDLKIDFHERANVIVGPNAMGKTTILEAIRLAKAVLAPRTAQESQQALISSGAVSPHLPQQLNLPAVARDALKPVYVFCEYKMLESEIKKIPALIPIIARSIVQASLGNANITQANLVSFLSSQDGVERLRQATEAAAKGVAAYVATGICKLELSIDGASQTITGSDQMSQLIVGSLEGVLAPHRTLFSYFPADRALPSGELQIQIGGPDVNAQLESHNSQPQTKYSRLKSTTVNNVLFRNLGDNSIESDFERIFSGLMAGKRLEGLEATPFGLVHVKISDVETGKSFDIDGMSSGEKGLLLTFLIIARNIAEGGIILLDEPELHLNPAVSKRLLSFLIDEYLVANQIQAIICSHSPEILGTAFERDDCTLHHLQSPTVVSPIYPKDKKEVFDALRRLGSSTSDVLFSKGSLFVEGEHDAEILNTGFSDLIARYRINALGGRTNVEREIDLLLAAEKKGEIDTLTGFIFDLDNRPSHRESTKFVKVIQWKRRCIENYLIDERILYDMLKDPSLAVESISLRGEVYGILRQLALSQLPLVAAELSYASFGFENPGLRPRELVGKSFPEMANVLGARLEVMQSQICSLHIPTWKVSFQDKCELALATKTTEWEADWLSLCDGKKLFADIQSRYKIKVSPLRFKLAVMGAMRATQSEGWTLIQTQVAAILA